MSKTMRSVEISSSDYEGKWIKARELLHEYINKGGTAAEGAVAYMRGNFVTEFAERPRFRFHFTQAGLQAGADGKFRTRVVVRNGRYEVVPLEEEVEAALPYLVEAIASMKPTAIVELGSGYGRILFQVAAELERRMPDAHFDFHACEITKGGRDLTHELHALAPHINLAVHHFDYYKPDVSFLPKDTKVLFYSVASVEQIPELPLTLAEALLGFPSGTQGVHIEPIGWQSDPVLLAQRYGLEGTLSTRIRQFGYSLRKGISKVLKLPVGFSGINLRPSDIGSDSNVRRNAAAWSLRKSYNRNMIKLFTTPPVCDRIVMKNLNINASGDNPFNPETILHWQRN